MSYYPDPRGGSLKDSFKGSIGLIGFHEGGSHHISTIWGIGLRVSSTLKRGPRSLGSTLLPFLFQGPLLKPNSRKKGTLIIKRLLRSQERGPNWGCDTVDDINSALPIIRNIP